MEGRDTRVRATSRPDGEVADAGHPSGSWIDYLRPLRLDHWIKNLVVPVGSLLALVAHRAEPTWAGGTAAAAAFVLSGLVSSINYAINEVLDAPYDALHPTKRHRPIPSGRVRVGRLMALTAGLAAVTLAAGAWWFPAPVGLGCLALFVAALQYNLPPFRLKDSPYLDALVESLTNPIRTAIGWYAVLAAAAGWPAAAGRPPWSLLLTIWACGAFLMTGKRLAELRLLGPLAAEYRPAFRAYTVGRLFVVQLGYGLLALAGMAWLLAAHRPQTLLALPLIAGLLAWATRMTFEPESPLIDPEHLYRRPVFLGVSLVVLAISVWLAV
jgi:4-hydroxybenzoate polyprenyltransferase